MHSWIAKYKIVIGVICITLMNLTSIASGKLPGAISAPVLAVEQAFNLNIFHEADSIDAQWQIANGNYLYQEKLQITLFDPSGKKLWVSQQKDLPAAIEVEDAYFGKQSIYKSTLSVPIALNQHLNNPNTHFFLQADYQGCSESGFCYPPQTHWFEIKLVDQKISSVYPLSYDPLENKEAIAEDNEISELTEITSKTELKERDLIKSSATSALNELKKSNENKHFLYAIAIFYLAGVLLSFTPCVLPMIPILFGIIVGQKHLNTRKAFRISLSYVLSMAFTYALAGIVVATLGKNLQAHFQYPIVIILFAALFAILGLTQIGVIYIKLPRYLSMNEILTKLHAKQASGTYIGAAIMGVLATLISSPCVTAPLIVLLGYISQSGDVLLGGSALLAMGLGMGTILLILGTLGGKYIPRAGAWMHTVNRFFAIAMFGFSIWLLDRVFHGPWILVLSAALCFYIAWCLMTAHSHRKWYYGIGLLFILYAFVLLWGAWLKESNPFKPLITNPWGTTISVSSESVPEFKNIQSLAELEKVQKTAQAQAKPLIAIFSAQWCTSCRQLEATVFSDPKVLQQLKDWEVVHLDVTTFNHHAEQLLKKFEVVGPPAILFFDKEGKELQSKRIVGSISIKNFENQLNEIKQELAR